MANQKFSWTPVVCLSLTQIISWGTLYYSFSVLLLPVTKSEGWPGGQIVGAFSLALLISALGALPTGVWLEKTPGRVVMTSGSVIAALAFVTLSRAHSIAWFYAGWMIVGVALALNLYEAAFAVLSTLYDDQYRRAVMVVTLCGGLASTVFWPLTESLVRHYDWRTTVLIYAAIHLLVCAPLHAFGLPVPQRLPRGKAVLRVPIRSLVKTRPFVFMSLSFMLNGIVASVVYVHIVSFMVARGMTIREAAWLAAIAGPMQVLGRVLEFTLGKRWQASDTGVLTLGLSALSVGLLLVAGSPLWLVAGIALFGATNGVITIVRTLIVVQVFGRERYSTVAGALLTPSLFARAAGPFAASALLSATGTYTSVLLAVLGVAIAAAACFYAGTRQQFR